MKVGVIISTYNQPEWLRLALEGWKSQLIPPDEIIIADDGSTNDTKQLIEYIAAHPSPLTTHHSLKHIWHEDLGFRKTEILNKAIIASTSDYLVFTDGDCIPRNDFLAAHKQHARKGRFLSGGYHKLPMETSRAIGKRQEAGADDQQIFDVKWLRRHGMPFSLKNLKLIRGGVLPSILDAVTTTRPTFNGHNASAWREDIVNANGFDTRMKYGGEDRELGERLENAGIKGYGIRYRAVCLHLDHDRGYINAQDLALNNRVREETHNQTLTRTTHGIR